jgi:hypothetical protein
VLGPVWDLLLRRDGGDGEGLAEQRLDVQLGELLHLDDAARLKDLVQMVGQLVVDGFDKLQKVGDLLHTIPGLLQCSKSGFIDYESGYGHFREFRL